jgi:hypothetical protein
VRFAALLLALYAAGGITAEIEVRVVRFGEEVPAAHTDVASRTLELLNSCTIESTSYAAHPSAWAAALKAESLVHLTFTSSQEMHFEGKARRIDEVLVPMPKDQWPSHILVRSGKAYLAFTFYDPRAFRDLVWGAPFELQNTPPYDAFANLPNY